MVPAARGNVEARVGELGVFQIREGLVLFFGCWKYVEVFHGVVVSNVVVGNVVVFGVMCGGGEACDLK